MVAGKVKMAIGFHKSPAHTKHENTPPPKPPTPSPSSGKSAPFSRSFGVYFPRSSAQVQPKPPDVSDLLRLVEDLRERESRLKTELLEHKLLRESAAIVPLLEADLAAAKLRVAALESDNSRLRAEKEESELRVKKMEGEIAELAASSKQSESSSFSSCSASSQRFQGLMEFSGKSNLMKTLRQRSFRENTLTNNNNHTEVLKPIHSRSNSAEDLLTDSTSSSSSSSSSSELLVQTNVRSLGPRVPKPPPIPSTTLLSPPSPATPAPVVAPPPPPPPPPPKMKSAAGPPPPPPPPKMRKAASEKVRRVPEVVEFYHSLMRRDSRREANVAEAPATSNARDMIGEIENRSTHLLAIKSDVEIQGEFIKFLIKEVESAAFKDIVDVVPFVKWLDDELSYLVDERAVLKHFEWPEKKADALREAAFGYCDLKKLESEASSFRDDPRHLCGPALKKMQALFEKLEHGVYNLSRVRESGTKKYKNFQIPTDWMLDSGLVNQIKLASVKLALKYMKRVSAELEMVGGGPEEEELIVQGVRFAFRAHQFAGGFDVETMRAFQELRDKARSCNVQYRST